MVIALFLVGAIFFREKFLSTINFFSIIDSVTMLSIAAIGVAFVTYSGNFADLSIPSIIACTGYISIDALQYGLFTSVLTALIFGLIIGIINAFAIGKLRANPIIFTLAMQFVLRGLVRWYWNNEQVYPDVKGVDENTVLMFENLYRWTFFEIIALPLVVLLLVIIVAHLLLGHTRFGKQLKVVGMSFDVARFTGISVARVSGIAFVISAVLASVTGLFAASLSRVGAHYIGNGYDFNAVTAIVVGGMTLAGGRGNILGVVGGAIFIALLRNLLLLFGVHSYTQTVIIGILFISVVGIQTYSLRKTGLDYE